jgi:hypothetical protein
MFVLISGLFHIIHCPLLILFPLIVQNSILDHFYVIYFFIMMLLYTFTDGECPVTYLCKKKLKISGINLDRYPELEYLFPNINTSKFHYYFAITTGTYLLILFNVIYRINIYSYFLIFTLLILSIYFLRVRSYLKSLINFTLFQKFTKYVVLITIINQINIFLNLKY